MRLKKASGVVIYQEQVIQNAQTLSGSSLGEAAAAPRHGQEVLRRGHGRLSLNHWRRGFRAGPQSARSASVLAVASHPAHMLARMRGFAYKPRHSARGLAAGYPLTRLHAST
ncbi:hypothetical protein NVS89_22195 [Ancylobacter sp. MQZ15Z-1]|uniref:DNA polymerase III alpha subunit finger domain-containing protein n=1 Tax=Ancylobacter mangrovi TaxID=2972472 RepID=A0A9X2PKK7_9HYPH|nr:hypothetical protein [Ancylobacter mangrovi]MCS0497805.1 hypothetical protein [Ancylobacter mangrovi]